MLSGIPYEVLWLVIAVVLGIIEAVTLGLVTLWFAVGAIVALLAALTGFSFKIQVILFIISSAVLLYFTRPIAKKYLKIRSERTNADRFIGETGIVIEKIDPVNGKGQVKIMGQVWTARSIDSNNIPEGAKVEVLEISGVKLLVKRLDE